MKNSKYDPNRELVDYLLKQGWPVVGVTEVAEQLDISKPTARKRLNTLWKTHKVEKRLIGRTHIYMPCPCAFGAHGDDDCSCEKRVVPE